VAESRSNVRVLSITPLLQHSITPSLDEFRALAKRGNLITLAVELVADAETPVSAFAKIHGTGPCFLFESAEKNDELGRFSFIGSDPLLMLQSREKTVSIMENGRSHELVTDTDPLRELEKVMARFRIVARSDLPRFVAGAVGFIGYDLVRFFEPSVPIHSANDLQLPEMMFMIARTMIVFDHRLRKLHVASNACLNESDRIEEVYERAKENLQRAVERLNQSATLRPIVSGRPIQLPSAESNTTRKEFESMVDRARELIAEGEIFQVVLSQRFETAFTGNAVDLYRCLRFGNPSPYMFCLSFGKDFTVLGSSPELHIRSSADLVEIRPIAGTRPRGENSAADECLARELLQDPKERAEHVMLIDLGRNDLGRVARFGSVQVTEQMVIERYSHVMHIVSHVTASLRDDRNSFDAVRATFPAGTVSGAPKIRAMQIIADLEKNRRGFYAGIVGYFGFDGSLDSCIALRSVVLKDGKAYFQAGAGIVADSDPAREYEETINKAKAMREAIARATQIEPNTDFS
jgi:anthranilate synthase component I